MAGLDLPDVPIQAWEQYTADQFRALTQPVLDRLQMAPNPAIEAIRNQVDPSNRIFVDQAVGAAQRAGIDPVQYITHIQQTSNFNPNAAQGDAKGIAQLNPQQAQGFGVNPSNPGQSLQAGARSLAQSVAEGRVDSSSHQAFVTSLTPLAQTWEQRTGIPASTWLAMAASESNWGKAGNALFGIKGSGTAGSLASPTWESEGGQRVNTSANFADYTTPNDAFQGFWNLVSGSPRYAGAIQQLRQGNPSGFVQAINQAGYATDPNWASAIASIAQHQITPLMGTANGPAPPSPLGSLLQGAGTAIAPVASAISQVPQQAVQSFRDYSAGLLHQFSQSLVPSQPASNAEVNSTRPSDLPTPPSPPQAPDLGGSSFHDWSTNLIGQLAQTSSVPPAALTSPGAAVAGAAGGDAAMPSPALSPSTAGYNDMVGASSTSQPLMPTPAATGGTPPSAPAPSFADWSTNLINQLGQRLGAGAVSPNAGPSITPASGPSYNDMVGANSQGQGAGPPILTSLDNAPPGIQAPRTPGLPLLPGPHPLADAVGNVRDAAVGQYNANVATLESATTPRPVGTRPSLADLQRGTAVVAPLVLGTLGGDIPAEGGGAVGNAVDAAATKSAPAVAPVVDATGGAIGKAPPTVSDALNAAKQGWAQVSQIAKDLHYDVSSHEMFLPMEIDTMEHAPGTVANAQRQIELYNEYTSNVVNKVLGEVRPQIEQLSTEIAGRKEAAYPELTRLGKGLLNDNGSLKEIVPLKQWQNLTGDTRVLAPNALVRQRGTTYVRPEYALDDVYQGEEAAQRFGKSFDNLTAFQDAMAQAVRRDQGVSGQAAQLKELSAKAQALEKAYYQALPPATLHDDISGAGVAAPPSVGPPLTGQQGALAGVPTPLAPPRQPLQATQPRLPTSAPTGGAAPSVRQPPPVVPPPSLGQRVAALPSGAARAINEMLAPAKNAPADVQTALRDFANRNLQAAVDAETWGMQARVNAGKADNAAMAARFETTGLTHANPTPAQTAFSNDLKNMTEATRAEGTAHGYINGDVTADPNGPVKAYFPHVYQDNLTRATAQSTKAGLSPSDFYSNSRVFPTLNDAVSAGFKPVDSFSGPIQHYVQRVGSSEAKYQLVADLKAASPAAVVDLPRGGKVPDGFVPGAAVSPQFTGVAFQDDVAKAVKNILNPSAVRSTALGRAFLGAQSVGKEVLFTLTGFHQLTELRQAISAGGIKAVPIVAKSVTNAFLPGAFEKLRLNEADGFSQAARSGVTGLTEDTLALDTGDRLSPGKAMAVRSLTGAVAGGASGYSQAKGAGADDQTALEHGLVGAGIGALAGPAGKLVSDSLWTRQVPTLKYLTWKLQVASGRDPQAAAAFVNNVYGGQNLAAIARSKTVQDALRTATLAPDWWESWTNQIGNAFKGGDAGGQARAFWARTAVASAFTLEGLNYALNGHFTDQNDPDHRFELDLKGLYDRLGVTQRNPKTGVPESTYMNVLPGPILSLLDLSSGNLGKFAMGRFATLPRVAAQAMSNRDYRGQEIVPPYTPLPEAIARQGANAVSQIAPIGGQQIQYSGTNNEPAGLTAFSTATGLRTAHPSAMPANGPVLSSGTRNQLAQAGVTINPSVGQSVAMLAPEHVNGVALARDERQAYQDQINKGVETALQAMMRKPAWAQASPEQRQQLVDTAIGSVTRREGLAVLRTVPQSEVETRLAVAKNGPAAAAYAWQHVPHYEGVGGSPSQVYQKNLSIEAAKATLARYAQIYKDPDVAEYHLAKDDPTAAKLAQYPDLDADYLSSKRAAIDKRFNGDLTKAERSGLVEVGLNAASTQ